MISQLTEGFLLGIATGTTCLATCGPVYAPYLMQYDRNIWRSFLALLEISAGRFVTYAVFGVAAGFLGAAIADVDRDLFTSSAYILFSVFLLLTAFRTNKKDHCCTTGKWMSIVDRPVLLGLFTGINFCPSFLLAVTKAVDLSGPLAGLAIFSSFFVGTSLFLVPLSFLGYFGIKKKIRIFARIAAVIVSTWFIAQAFILLHNHFKEKYQASNIDPKLILNVLDKSPSFIVTDDSLSLINLQSGLVKAKKQSVKFVSSSQVAKMPDTGIFYIGQELIAGKHLENHPLRKKGRFLIVLPDSSNHGFDTVQVRKLIDFLSFYSFKIDPDSGSVFQIPASFSMKDFK
jgi:sulfite exporter TauE/SafE